jgi:hypothetical protein
MSFTGINSFFTFEKNKNAGIEKKIPHFKEGHKFDGDED